MEKSKPTEVTIPGKHGGKPLILKLDWERRKKDKYIRVSFGDEQGKISAKDFWRAAFLVAPTDAQTDMIPTKDKVTRYFYKTLKIKATADIKEGDLLTVNAKLEIPEEIIDDILGIKKLDTTIPTNDVLTIETKQTP